MCLTFCVHIPKLIPVNRVYTAGSYIYSICENIIIIILILFDFNDIKKTRAILDI